MPARTPASATSELSAQLSAQAPAQLSAQAPAQLSAQAPAQDSAQDSAPPIQQPAPQVRRRRGRAEPEIPLGSLTQREHRTEGLCVQCGSTRITRLALNLTDGTPVSFTSCHRCEHRTWDHDGDRLSVQTVLDRARKD